MKTDMALARNPDHLLYLAYGSNMASERLRRRVPSAAYRGRATLPQHRLAFHKAGKDGSAKCDAYWTGEASDTVWGVLFEIAPEDLPSLDAAEGPRYDRTTLEVYVEGEEPVEAITYRANTIDTSFVPYVWYRTHVWHGAREHGLPEAYIAGIEAVPARHDPDPSRRKRELGVYESRGQSTG